MQQKWLCAGIGEINLERRKKKIENVTEREERKAKGREVHTEHVSCFK